MVGDREKCLRYGMDEYISKPISIDEIREVLSQWICFEPAAEALESKDASTHVVDLSQFQFITGGDKEAERELATLYQEQSENKLKILSENCVEGTSSEWCDAAHAMKGGAASIGAKQLAKLCNEAQYLDNVPVYERISYLEKISHEYERVIAYLKTAGIL